MFQEDAEIRRDIKKLKSRIKKSPLLFARLADCYIRIGEMDLAEKTLKAGIGKFPNYTTSLLVLGELYLYRGFYRDAEEVALKGLQLEPNHLGLLQLLQRIKKGMECDQECAKIQIAIAKLDPLRETAAETSVNADDEIASESGSSDRESETLPPPSQMWKLRVLRKQRQIESTEAASEKQSVPSAEDESTSSTTEETPPIPSQTEYASGEEKIKGGAAETSEFTEYLKDISIHRLEDEKIGLAGEEPESPQIKPRIATRTLGELYAKQNQFAEAITIYEKLVESDPDNESFRARLEELKAQWELSMEESSREPADG